MNERTTIGGVVYESIGSSTSNLLLKCNGVARIQWGNKLIDLIKNGHVNTQPQTDAFVKGMIVMYSGSEQIPEGWAVCDGSTSTYQGETITTPNLVKKFIKNTETNAYSLVYIIKL